MDDSLLIKFIEEKATREEGLKVLNWIEKSDDNKHYFAKLQTIWAATEICKNQQNDLAAIRQIIKKVHERKNKAISVYKYIAAACILIAVIGGSIAYLWNPNPGSDTPDYEAALRNISQTEDITIKLSAEKEIQLTDSIPIVSYSKNRIIINDSIEVAEENSEALNTIHIPFGKRSKLILSDGTMVHLNSGSTLVYPTEFNQEKREVYLDGEAYFEVVSADRHPFIVQTLYRTVEVYGTTFNVSVDRELKLFETTLVSGSVAVKNENSEEKLAPNQCYSYSDNTKKAEIKEVDADDYILWTEGKLQFQKEVLYKAIRKLEKIYNIEIKLTDNKYLNYKVSGFLNLNDNAEETVRNLMSTIHRKKADSQQAFYLIIYRDQ